MQKGRQIAPVTPGRGPKWVNPELLRPALRKAGRSTYSNGLGTTLSHPKGLGGSSEERVSKGLRPALRKAGRTFGSCSLWSQGRVG